MAPSSTDEPRTPVIAVTVTDPTLDDVLHAAGFVPTAAGKQRWRQRLSTPIPADVLDEGRRMLDQARGTAA